MLDGRLPYTPCAVATPCPLCEPDGAGEPAQGRTCVSRADDFARVSWEIKRPILCLIFLYHSAWSQLSLLKHRKNS